jgi:preprotein translocase subunit SecE
MEKSQVTADYVARRTAEAQQAGSAAAANESNDFFAGLDLSKIRQAQTIDPNAPPPPDENLPSMFYEVDELLSDEDKAIADPASKLPILEQALGELQATKWPTPWAALREVGVVIIMIALTGYMVLAWDNGLRWLYTDILHFIPSPDELAEYTNRFDGLDLPPGWTDNMDEGDISKFSDAVLSAPSEN